MTAPDWRGPPTAAEAHAHAQAHPAGATTVDPVHDHEHHPGPGTHGRGPYMVVGLWMARTKRPPEVWASQTMRRSQLPRNIQPQLLAMGAHDGRVWFAAFPTMWLHGCRWVDESEYRPVRLDGMATPWPLGDQESAPSR